jgi:subtilase family serine protease
MEVSVLRTRRALLASVASIVVLVGSAAGWLATTRAVASGARIAVGTPVTLPLLSVVNGPQAPSTQLRLSVALKPRDPSGLASYATAVSTPGSAQFGDDLSVPQFAARFGASPAAISAVTNDLRGAGLTVAGATANGLLLPVSGTAAQINQALDVSLQSVTLAQGRTTYANLAAPSLPANVAPDVQGVTGLDDSTPPQPATLERASHGTAAAPGAQASVDSAPQAVSPRVVTGGPQPTTACQTAIANATSGNDGGAYTADELAADYGFSSLYKAGDLGAGQTVAVVEFGAYDTSDISAYQSCYGTSATVTPVNVAPAPTGGVVEDGEAALDIETIIGLAPKATVDVYETSDDASSQVPMLNQIAADDTAKVVSDSNGLCESETNNLGASIIATENTTLEEMAAQGQSFFASSGDSGSAMCSQIGEGNSGYSTGLSVIDPASQPDATSIGGTRLFSVETPASGSTAATVALDTNGASPSEYIWNDGPNSECGCTPDYGDVSGGGGGGISMSWTMPSYQSAAPPSLGVDGPDSAGANFCGAATCRETPDVSADADPVTGYAIYSTGSNGRAGWGQFGGTSASAPLWAAFAALTNASAGCSGQDIGFANPALYAVAGTAYATNFHDTNVVTSLETTSNGTTSPNQPVDNDTFEGGGSIDQANGLYPEAAGYDMATGLGSMIAPALSASLCKLQAQKPTVTVNNPGAQTATAGSPFLLQITGTDSAGESVVYAATGLPAGLTISGSGAITGTPTAPGTATVTVTGTDPLGAAGTTSFTVTVAAAPVAAPAPVSPPAPVSSPAPVSTPKPGTGVSTGGAGSITTSSHPGVTIARPAVSSAALSGVKTRNAKLTFTVTRGANGPDIRTLVISLPIGLSFRSTAKALKQGAVISGGKAQVKLAHGKLTVTFTAPVARAKVTLSAKLIATSAATAKRARAKKPSTVSARVVLTTTSGTATLATLRLKL